MKKYIRNSVTIFLCAALIMLCIPFASLPTDRAMALEQYIATKIWDDVLNDGNFTSEFVSGDIVAITSAEDLIRLSEYVLNGKNTAGVTFYQMNDIRMNPDAADDHGEPVFGEFIPWTPIGNEEYPFRGTYDGCNFRIKGLFLYDAYMSFGGLFGYAVNSSLRNIVLTHSHILGYSAIGGIVGRLEYGRIENCICDSCYVGGQLLFQGGSEHIGGIAGDLFEASVADSSFLGKAEGGMYIGGIVGFIENDDTFVGIERCRVTGSVSSAFSCGSAGGIAGYAFSNSLDGNVDLTFYACTNEANVSCPDGEAGSLAAGIVAYSRIQNDGDIVVCCCDNKGTVFANNGTAAGISGKLTIENPGTTFEVKRCYNVGSVTGNEKAKAISAADDEQYAFDCYYLDESGTDKYSGKADEEQFRNGYVCYMLNFKQDTIEFYQTLGYDDYPVTDPSHAEVLYSAEEDTYENEDHVPETDSDGYYIITTPWQFRWFANEVKSGSYSLNAKLGKDIVFNTDVLDYDANIIGDGYEKYERPIGFCMFDPELPDYAYQGTFDGCGHMIRGIYYDGDSYGSSGLFGYLGKNGKIRNLILADSYFSDRIMVGGLVGYNEGLIENCEVYAYVSCEDYIAGIICGRNDGIIKNCTSSGKVTGPNELGGICGFMSASFEGSSEAKITDCTNSAAIYVYEENFCTAGGIVGFTQSMGGNVAIERCSAFGEIYSYSGYENVIGGVAGTISTAHNGITNVKNCYSTGVIFIQSGSNGIYDYGTCSGVIGRVEFYDPEDSSSVNIENCFFDSMMYVPSDCTGVRSGILSAPVDERLCCLNDYYMFGGNGDFGWGTNCDEAAFMSGEVCFWLNFGEEKPVFYQTLGKNVNPVLDSREGIVSYKYPDYYNELPETVDGFCIIEDVFDLYWFVGQVNSGNSSLNARLAKDIVINENVCDADGNVILYETNFWWSPIGFRNSFDDVGPVCYTGTFDGNGHKISGIFCQDTYSPITNGFIGYLGEGGVIKDLGITDSYFYVNGNTGVIAGWNSGTISGCFADAVILTNDFASTGGIAGINDGTVEYCVFNSDFFGGNAIGNDTGSSENVFGSDSHDFASGLVCATINAFVSDGNQVWYQDLMKDRLPVSSGKTVFCCNGACSNSDIHTDEDKDHYCDNCSKVMNNWYNIDDYIVTGKKTAPIVRKKIFSGWFIKDTSFNRDNAVGEDTLSGMAVAKFVDENVLKADMILDGYDIKANTASVRISTTVDDLSYSEVGFIIEAGGKSVTKMMKTVYDAVTGLPESYIRDAFSKESEFIATYTITDIPASEFDTGITVTPIWITLDGTKVEGIAASASVNELIRK